MFNITMFKARARYRYGKAIEALRRVFVYLYRVTGYSLFFCGKILCSICRGQYRKKATLLRYLDSVTGDSKFYGSDRRWDIGSLLSSVSGEIPAKGVWGGCRPFKAVHLFGVGKPYNFIERLLWEKIYKYPISRELSANDSVLQSVECRDSLQNHLNDKFMLLIM